MCDGEEELAVVQNVGVLHLREEGREGGREGGKTHTLNVSRNSSTLSFARSYPSAITRGCSPSER